MTPFSHSTRAAERLGHTQCVALMHSHCNKVGEGLRVGGGHDNDTYMTPSGRVTSTHCTQCGHKNRIYQLRHNRVCAQCGQAFLGELQYFAHRTMVLCSKRGRHTFALSRRVSTTTFGGTLPVSSFRARQQYLYACKMCIEKCSIQTREILTLSRRACPHRTRREKQSNET